MVKDPVNVSGDDADMFLVVTSWNDYDQVGTMIRVGIQIRSILRVGGKKKCCRLSTKNKKGYKNE